MYIKTVSDLRRAARIRYAWPGGYPTHFVCSDGEALCHDCLSKMRRNVIEAVAAGSRPGGKHRSNDGWRVVNLDINWEDNELRCVHCSRLIETASGGGAAAGG